MWGSLPVYHMMNICLLINWTQNDDILTGSRAEWTCRSVSSMTAAATKTVMQMTARQRRAWTRRCHPWYTNTHSHTQSGMQWDVYSGRECHRGQTRKFSKQPRPECPWSGMWFESHGFPAVTVTLQHESERVTGQRNDPTYTDPVQSSFITLNHYNTHDKCRFPLDTRCHISPLFLSQTHIFVHLCLWGHSLTQCILYILTLTLLISA